MRFCLIIVLPLMALFTVNCSSTGDTVERKQTWNNQEQTEDTQLKQSGFFQATDDFIESDDIKMSDNTDEIMKQDIERESRMAREDVFESAENNESENEFKEEEEPQKRGIASFTTTFKGGLYRFSERCMMKSSPRASSADRGWIAASKKLWVDKHNSRWLKVYKKSGAVYIQRSCLE